MLKEGDRVRFLRNHLAQVNRADGRNAKGTVTRGVYDLPANPYRIDILWDGDARPDFGLSAAHFETVPSGEDTAAASR